jgi:crotonobetainyl-CoA:carnitine CoA-transferase CaiB-like acyl-CoA transferase
MGPYCTMLMARMGADVIKVEAPDGDVVRGVGRSRNAGMGPYFLSANQGKRSIAIDLKTDSGRAAMHRVIANADVFVTNVRPNALSRLGLDADTLMAIAPQLVHVALLGFGTGGPYSGRAAYDDVIQAAGGLAAVQGGAEPEYIRTVLADKASGLMALSSTLAALLARASTGQGQRVEVPMFETIASFTLLEQQGGHVFEPPLGPTGYSRTESPYRRPYRTTDGYLGVVVYTDRQWKSFFDFVGRPDLMENERFSTIARRTENIDELYELLGNFLLERPTDEWVGIFEQLGIAAQPILGPLDLLADQHLAAVGFFETVDHPTEGTLKLPRLPVIFNNEIAPAPIHAPGLGEHGEQILTEAGLDPSEIHELLDSGVLVPDSSTHSV